MSSPFAFGPFGPIELTDEQRAELQRQKDLHNMAHEEAMRSVNALLDSLDVEQLTTLKMMLGATQGDANDSYSTHTMGWISSLLYYKFGICGACGKKHDDPDDILKETPDGE